MAVTVKGQASQTVVDLTDGFSVSLSQDSVAWNGGTSTLGTNQTVAVTVTAYQGSSAAASYSVGTPTRSDTTNCTTTVSGTTVNITVKATATQGGTVTIPVTVTTNGSSVVLNKTFSYSIAFKGTTGGAGPTGVSMRNKGAWASGVSYTAGTSGGTYIDIVTLDGSSYACKSSHTSSSTNKPPNSTYWTLISEKGDQGDEGPQGPQGEQGDEGAPAPLVVITGDTTLRNNSGSTTLTAYVYVGGSPATVALNGTVTLNGTTIGTIKWYKGSSTTGTAGSTCSVSADDVTNSLVVYAKLELEE